MSTIELAALEGEAIPDLELGGLAVLGPFLSFFLGVFVKFAVGLVAEPDALQDSMNPPAKPRRRVFHAVTAASNEL